jgi:hypothetical protein
MTADKKYWSQPQLIVLARGTPDESVLEGCKNNNKGAHGTSNGVSDCNPNSPTGGCPAACSLKPLS